jgi:hypothetical protein
MRSDQLQAIELRIDTALSQEQLRRMAGDFGRRVRAFCQKHQIPLQYCEIGDKTKKWCGMRVDSCNA